MTVYNRFGLLGILKMLSVPSIFILCSTTQAQSSLSANLSDPLSSSSSVSGFNSTFEADASNLTNEERHSDISDATHSQLLGSVFSPLQNSSVFSSVDTAPRTSTLTDAQSAVGYNDSYFGGRHSQNFSLTNRTSGNTTGVAARQVALSELGASSMQSAFTGSTSNKAAFSGQSSSSTADTALGFSGEGVVIPQTQSGVGYAQTLVSTNSSNAVSAYHVTDPVLSGDSSAYLSAYELHGDLLTPSAQVGQVYADNYFSEARYQYDDGQTPAINIPPRAGFILGSAPEYGPPSNGFPDSTKGLAGLPSETSNFASPFAPLWNSSNSPFAPVSEGTVYGLTTRFNPSLHNMPTMQVRGSFQAFEQRAQEQRLIHGLSISDSSTIYQQDLRNYRAQSTNQQHRPTLQEMDNKNQRGGARELIPSRSIR